VQGDDAQAEILHSESLEFSRTAQDPAGIARALFGLADVALRRRDADRADALLSEALTLNRSIGDSLWEAACLVSLGQVALIRNDGATASDLIGQGIVIYRRLGYTWGTAWATAILGHLKRELGDTTGAASLFRESASLAQHHRDNKGIATALDGLAVIAANASQPDIAAQLFGASQALAESVGAPFEESITRDVARAAAQSALGAEVFASELETGRSLSIQDAISLTGRVAVSSKSLGKPGSATSAIPAAPTAGILSPREIEVLRLLADGRSAQEIAGDLFISHRTVTTHISNILGKLGVDSRAAAVAVALRNGLV
jgi:non-specific serine/threonine protein kinase